MARGQQCDRVACNGPEPEACTQIVEERRALLLVDERVVERAAQVITARIGIGHAADLISELREVVLLEPDFVNGFRIAGGNGLEAHATPFAPRAASPRYSPARRS
jgi:hypothetical protein